MAKTVLKEQLNEITWQVDVHAPLVAKKGQAGQFVIVMLHERSEKIPLTLADMDKDRGTITLVFSVQGKSTMELARVEPGSEIFSITGPLGKPAEIENFGTVVFLGGGCGVAPVHAQAKAFKEAGNHVIAIIGFRSESLVFWEEKMRGACDELIIATDDGSKGFKGFTTQALQVLVDEGKVIDRVISIGPLIMMANTVGVTRPLGIPTVVSLNALMVDGTGMCGCCRVQTSTGVKFSCVDGPDMDGFSIDFKDLLKRGRKFKEEEAIALKKFKQECNCTMQAEPCE